jgi:hypothetical protein
VAHGALGGAKKAETENRTVVFINEAGFYMLPSVLRTYTPQGETPVMEGSASRDHVSAISGITTEGRLLTGMQEEAFDRHGIVDFLRHVLRHIEGKNPFSLFQLSLHSCLNIHRKGPTFRFLRVFSRILSAKVP